MKASLITTVKNEQNTIDRFLESIAKQSVLPDELIIVDGGSTDKTIDKITFFLKKNKKIHAKLLIKKGNRSGGRNEAIKHTKNELILCSDAGCILDKKWVEEITKPFVKKEIDVVAGFYLPVTKNIFQKSLAAYTSTMPDKVNSATFLPSSRSVAFRKEAWKKVKGYPEELDTCEDLVFDKRLKKIGAMFVFQKSALVYWPQRKNILEAAKQFFSYAKGDGRALYIRKQTPLLFIRYLLGFMLLSLGSLFNKLFLTVDLLVVGFFAYLLWAIAKNYRYVKSPFAFFWLPSLQLISDIAVMSGTTLGLVTLAGMHALKIVKNNKLTTLVICIYALVVLGGINWGIPNTSHPFAYYMDEWASAFSIRTLFRHGSPNINGGAHGVVFFYFLSGLYLIPFILLHIINPFIIKGPFSHMDQQHALFQILRIYSLLNGIGAAMLIAIISKKYLSIKPIYSVLYMVATPLFLVWSLFFKYDMAVTFWIIFSLFSGLRFIQHPTKKSYLLFGAISALAVCTKISAAPLGVLYIISFFLFIPHFKQKKSWLLNGIGLFIGIFIFFGIPDFLIASKEFLNSIYINIAISPFSDSLNYNFGMAYQWFYLFFHYPAIYGLVFYAIFIGGTIFLLLQTIRQIAKRNYSLLTKKYLFLVIGFLLFLGSLLQIRFSAQGNRMLVILPFFALFSAYLTNKVIQVRKPLWLRIFIGILFCCLMFFQVFETFSIFATEAFLPDPRQTSSQWIEKNIPRGSTIGLEDLPIFQFSPDTVLKEYYENQYNIALYHHIYNYQIINSKTQTFPEVVVLTNVNLATSLLKESPKKDLIKKLLKQGYTQKIKFTPDKTFLHYFYNNDARLNFVLYSMPTDIIIYEK